MKTIRQIRQRKGLSLRRLAARAGVHWTTIWKVEKAGRMPSLRTLHKLAKALKVSITDLLLGG
jgi:transcriptional regulator with XRE-family HTH domain